MILPNDLDSYMLESELSSLKVSYYSDRDSHILISKPNVLNYKPYQYFNNYDISKRISESNETNKIFTYKSSEIISSTGLNLPSEVRYSQQLSNINKSVAEYLKTEEPKIAEEISTSPDLGSIISSKKGLYDVCSPTLTSKEYNSIIGLNNIFNQSSTVLTHNPTLKDMGFKTFPKDVVDLDNANNPTFDRSTFFVLDLETSPSPSKIQIPYIIGISLIYNGKIDKSWYYRVEQPTYESLKDSIVKLLNDITAMYLGNKPVYLFAHNGGRFDFKILINSIALIFPSDKQNITVTCDQDHDFYQIIFNYKRPNASKGRKIVLRDSFKIINARADLASKSFGSIKLSKINFNHDVLQMNNYEWGFAFSNVWTDIHKEMIPDWSNYSSPKDYIIAYVIRDCEIVGDALVGISKTFKNRLNLHLPISKTITISGIAITIFLEKYYNLPIIIIPNGAEYSKFIRKSYIGGRCEVFNSGYNLPVVYHFDVPGMYANVMASNDLPIGNPLYLGKVLSTHDASKFIDDLHNGGMIGFFRCKVSAPTDLNIPVLPHKEPAGKLLFPLGSFYGNWSSYELKLAISRGYKVVLEEGYVFKTGSVLKEYTNTFTEIKDKAGAMKDLATRNIAKLILNSLYGKFAANYHDSVTAVVNEDEFQKLSIYHTILNVTNLENDIIMVTYNLAPKAGSKDSTDHYNKICKDFTVKINNIPTNIALASAITSKARCLLYSLMVEATEKIGGTLCYVDTDSIFAYFPENPENKPFGSFIWVKDEKSTLSKTLFMAPKMYYYETAAGNKILKIKGVGKNAIKDITYSDLFDIFQNRTKFTVKGVIQFISKKDTLKHLLGVEIKANVVKVYDLFKSTKREWVFEQDSYFTIPKVLDQTDAAVALAKRAETSAEKRAHAAFIDNAQKNLKYTPFVGETFEYDQLYYFKQYVVADKKILVTKVNLDDIKGDFSKEIIINIVGSVIANCDKGAKISNHIKTAITLFDNINNTHKTVIILTTADWYLLTPEISIKVLIRALNIIREKYQDNFIPTDVIFNVSFQTMPFVVGLATNVKELIIKSGVQALQKLTPKTLLMQNLEKSKEALDEYMAMETKLQNLTRIVDTLYKTHSTEWINEVKLVLEDMSINLSEKIKSYILGSLVNIMLKRDPSITKVNLDNVCDGMVIIDKTKANGVLLPFKIWIIASGMTIDKIASNILVKIANKGSLSIAESLDFMWKYNQKELEIMTISYEFVTRLVDKELLCKVRDVRKVGGKSKTFHDYVIHPKWKGLCGWSLWQNFLSHINFTKPVDLTLADAKNSKTELEVLSKLSSQKMTLNKPYAMWLLDLLKKSNDIEQYNNIKKLFGFSTDDQISSGIIGLQLNLNMLNILIIGIEFTNSEYFYIKWILDFRGRKYPTITQFSHMGPNYIQPLFILKDVTHVSLKEIEMMVKNKEVFIMTGLYKELCDIVDITKVNSFKDLYNELYKLDIKLNSGDREINWSLKARILELGWIIANPDEKIPLMPTKYDAKCNAYQHLSTLVGDKKIMSMVGIGESKRDLDIYETIAKITLDMIKRKYENPDSEQLMEAAPSLKEILDNLYDKPKIMRDIVKKPVMTKSYAVTFKRSLEYVGDSLISNNIKLRKMAQIELTRNIWERIKALTYKESRFMSKIQTMVSKHNNVVEWVIKPISDFKVVIDYPKLINAVIKSKLPISFNIKTAMKDMPAMKRAITANVIHSLDALNCRLSVLKYNKNILTIHDAFLIDSLSSSDELQLSVWQAFVQIHGEVDMAGSIHDQIAEQTKNSEKWVEFLVRNNISKDPLYPSQLLVVDRL